MNMKTKIFYILFALLVTMASCSDDDIEFSNQWDSDFDYISFDSSSLSFLEGTDNDVNINVTLSTTDYSTPRTLRFTVSEPSDVQAAVAGVDYELLNTSGNLEFPANEAVIGFPIIRILDNSVSRGSRYLDIELQPLNGFNLGRPGDQAAYKTRITIFEDDFVVLGETSFEDVTTFIGDVTYSRHLGEDQPNNQIEDPTSDDPYVDFAATENEMGFDMSADPGSLFDGEGGERMGVLSNANMDTEAADFETRFTNTEQGYVFSDMDGTAVLRFDYLDGVNENITNPIVEVQLYFANTGYEEEDFFKVFWETEDGLGQPLLSFIASEVDEVSGVWNLYQLPIPSDQLKRGRVVIQCFSSSNSEMYYIDYVGVKGIL